MKVVLLVDALPNTYENDPEGGAESGGRRASGSATRDFTHEEEGYRKNLGSRQLKMIAIGGAIGTGLFLGAGARLESAGPSLALTYAVCGFFAFLILRALGELVLYRPSSGSFVSYAREFYGEKMAFVAGWFYFLNWAMVSIVDVTAIALYTHYWSFFTFIPQWGLALIALVVVLSLNLVSVKVFGEMEFWFAIVKVGALVSFLIIGSIVLALGFPTKHGETGLIVWANNGGLFPAGLLPAVVVIQGVVFAYAAIELLGTAAGETANPAKVMPRAVNTVIIRVAVFYVGSVVLLSLLLPHTAYKAGESPFVTFFSSLGGQQTGEIAGTVMNFVVLTAALSSLNAGLYSTGRILRSMTKGGAAPRFTGVVSKRGVPYGGILLTGVVTLAGVGLNAWVPSQVFEIVLNVSALCMLAVWAVIVLCQLKLQRWAKTGKAIRPSFRLFGAPFTSYLTLAFLVAVAVIMAFDWPVGTLTISSLVVIVPALIVGWYVCRDRIMLVTATHTSAVQVPVQSQTPPS